MDLTCIPEAYEKFEVHIIMQILKKSSLTFAPTKITFC